MVQLKMNMLFSSKRFIFLTFSDIAIKGTVIDVALRKPKIIFTDQKTLPEGVVFDEKIVDFVRFKEEVRSFLLRNKSNLKTRKIIFGINEQEVFFHKIDLTDGSEGKQEAISTFLSTRLPFSLQEASVRYLQRIKYSTQIVSTKFLLLQDLASIFESTGFELVTLSPIPLACLNLLGKEIEPYLFILVEDQSLQFALVVNQTIVFSASLKLIKTLESSKSLIIKTIKNMVEFEYANHKKEHLSLRNVFVIGNEAEIIKIYLSEEDLKVETIDLLKQFTAEDTSDLVNYIKNLFLSFTFDNTLNFTGRKFTSGIEEVSKLKMKAINFGLLAKIAAVFVGIFLVIFAFGFIRQNLPTKNQIKKSVATVSPKIEKPVSTTSAAIEKPVADPPTQPSVPVSNKQDYIIEVLNGTVTKGLAGQTKDFLTSKGYSVTTVGNAPSANYEQTVIQYKVSKEAIVSDLTSTLSERYSVIRGDQLNENDRFDIIIIVGRK